MSGRTKSAELAEDEWEEAEEILDHQFGANGGYEYLVRWVANDPATNKQWETWEPADNVSKELVRAYNFMGARTPRFVPVNVWDIAGLVRDRVSRVLSSGDDGSSKHKGGCRARLIEMPVPELCTQALGDEFLSLVSEPWLLPKVASSERQKLVIKTTVDAKDGVVTKELHYKTYEDVADFCSLQDYLGSKQAQGLMRFNIGRDSNVDMMAFGIPILFKFTINRTSNMVTFTISLATVHFNGAFGTPTFPHMSRGMLKEPAHRDALVAHVRANLPSWHPLVDKGWTTLPPTQYSLDASIAVPDTHSTSQGEHIVSRTMSRVASIFASRSAYIFSPFGPAFTPPFSRTPSSPDSRPNTAFARIAA